MPTNSNNDDLLTLDELQMVFRAFFSTAEIKENVKKIINGQDVNGSKTTKLRTGVNELLNPQAISDQIKRINEVLKGFDATHQQQSDSSPNIDLDGLEDYLMNGPLKQRFKNEFFLEKQKIAKFAFENFFVNSDHCWFLQASTTLLHMVPHLSRYWKDNRRTKHLGLYHTNSTVFAYMMLGKQPHLQVRPVSGPIHDPLCCGWLFNEDDEHATQYLKDLFTRSEKPLTHSLITPQFMTIDGKMLFAREETAHLARTLLEMSPITLISNAAGRFYKNTEELTQYDPWDVDLEVGSGNERHLVIAGKFKSGTIPQNSLIKSIVNSSHARCYYSSELSDEFEILN